METERAKEPRRSALTELADDPSSRKRFLKTVGGAGALSAFSIFLAACGGDDEEEQSGGTSTTEGQQAKKASGGDLEIVQYALTLEHL